MFTDPSRREVLKEAGVKFAHDNKLLFIEESSALADINIAPLVELLIKSEFNQGYMKCRLILSKKDWKLVNF